MEGSGQLYRGPGIPAVQGVWRAGVLVKSGGALGASIDRKEGEMEETKEKEGEEEKEEDEQEEGKEETSGVALGFVRVRDAKSCGKEAARSEEEGGKEEVVVGGKEEGGKEERRKWLLVVL
jgi:hypothetical protein